MPFIIALLLAGLALTIFGSKWIRIGGIALAVGAIALIVLFLGMSPSGLEPVVTR